jgi:hypothetical protein
MLAPLTLAAAVVMATPAPAARPVYESLRAQIDSAGRLLAADEAAWAHARPLTWGPQSVRTEFRALWSDRGLFVRFDAKDTHPWHTLRQRDARLWEEEVVEIYLTRDPTARAYTELQVNPGNVVCDLHVDLPRRNFDTRWNVAGLESHVYVRDDRWVTIAFLPWHGLESPTPKAGERWRFNVFRIERPGGPQDPKRGALLLAWSPTGGPSFHVPEAFGELLFR